MVYTAEGYYILCTGLDGVITIIDLLDVLLNVIYYMNYVSKTITYWSPVTQECHTGMSHRKLIVNIKIITVVFIYLNYDNNGICI